MKKFDRPTVENTNKKLEWKSDVVAELLAKSDIPYITLNPGASYRGLHDSLVNYLGNTMPQMLLCLHEDHVVSIAHGYAKATDKPLACALHSNVGLMHGLMGIFNAWADRVPMLILGATGPVEPEKRRPWIDWIHTAKDQGALLRSYVKWDDEPRSTHGLIEAVIRGLQVTNAAPKAPVYICLDAGLQEERLEDGIELPDMTRFRPPQAPGGSSREVAEVAKLLKDAKRPVIMFGRGSRQQLDWDHRVALAEATGAAVLTSLRERCAFPTNHPQHIGPPSGWVSAGARAAIQQADLLISFDWADLNGYLQQINRQTSKIGAKIVHVSLDSALHNGWSMDHFGLAPADVLISADPDHFLANLLSEYSSISDQKRAAWLQHEAPKPRGFNEKSSQKLVPHDIEAALAELRSQHAFTLAHTTIGWAATDYPFEGPLDYLGHDGGGGLAAGPGLTIGAALALKDTDRVVVGVLGDGDFMQGATALWTAAHYDIPALFIVSNNRSNFNDEIHQESVAKVRSRPVENRWIGQRIDDPAIDLAALAKAQGVQSIGPVNNVPDLMAAIRKGIEVVKSGKPFFIDATVEPGYANILLSRHG